MKKLRSIIPLLFVIIFILFISGYRFTAKYPAILIIQKTACNSALNGAEFFIVVS